jgi:hypothetical protein
VSEETPHFPRAGFKAWEKALLVLACLLFGASLALYVSDFPLARYIFDLGDEGHHPQVGLVGASQGSIRRELDGESEFKPIKASDPLFDDDVVVTGPDGGATLQLDDGSLLELGPDSMVRLHFTSKLSLGGISRAAAIDVVTGSVKSRPSRGQPAVAIPVRRTLRPAPIPRLTPSPKPAPVAVAPPPAPSPSPSPSPTPTVDPYKLERVELISPKDGVRLSLPSHPARLELPVAFDWSARPAGKPVQITLYKLGPGRRRTQLYRSVAATDAEGRGRATVVVKSPGKYEWELRDGQGRPLAEPPKARFALEPEFEGIDPIEPLIGGKAVSSSRLSGSLLNDFDITLRWKPYPGATRYRVIVRSRRNDAKGPTLERMVTGPSFRFSHGQVFSGQFYYQIKAEARNGFIARSELKPFVFSFLAPAPTMPADRSVIDAEQLEQENDSVLMTWQKTNFTDWYEIQLSTEPDFKKILRQQRQRENFYVFKSPAPGRYFWRVRSSSKDIVSPFSRAYELTIKR